MHGPDQPRPARGEVSLSGYFPPSVGRVSLPGSPRRPGGRPVDGGVGGGPAYPIVVCHLPGQHQPLEPGRHRVRRGRQRRRGPADVFIVGRRGDRSPTGSPARRGRRPIAAAPLGPNDAPRLQQHQRHPAGRQRRRTVLRPGSTGRHRWAHGRPRPARRDRDDRVSGALARRPRWRGHPATASIPGRRRACRASARHRVAPHIRFDATVVGLVQQSNAIVQDDIDQFPTFVFFTPALGREAVADGAGRRRHHLWAQTRPRKQRRQCGGAGVRSGGTARQYLRIPRHRTRRGQGRSDGQATGHRSRRLRRGCCPRRPAHRPSAHVPPTS